MCSVKNQKNEKPGNPCSFGRQVQNSARDVKSGKFGHSDGSPPWRPAAVDTRTESLAILPPDTLRPAPGFIPLTVASYILIA